MLTNENHSNTNISLAFKQQRTNTKKQVAKPRESNSRPRPRANPRRRLVASKTAQIPPGYRALRKSASTKSPRIAHQKVAVSTIGQRNRQDFKTDLRFNPPRCWPCKKRPKRTWLACSKTPTCARSTPRESPSCRRMSNWREESEANARKQQNTNMLKSIVLFRL